MSKSADILVIDDEEVVNDAVVKIGSLNGLSVDTATDVRIAFGKLQQSKYRLIVCDIMMPDADGFQFLAEMAQKKIETPVIMTTGYSTLDNAVESLYQGAIDFVPKPFTADELLSSIHRGLRYGEIQRTMPDIRRKSEDISLAYVPCPSTYYRLGYTSWLSPDRSGIVAMGITDLFLKTIDVVRAIDIQEMNHEIEQGNVCALIQSTDNLVHPVLSPVSGRIVEVNEELVSSATILEKDPYFKGWIYRIIPSELEYELKHLISCSSDRL
jgi:CheY-like chemotaxis protein/glycine cleavage system H lipoate-binding protein